MLYVYRPSQKLYFPKTVINVVSELITDIILWLLQHTDPLKVVDKK